jgi:hypothetical protein
VTGRRRGAPAHCDRSGGDIIDDLQALQNSAVYSEQTEVRVPRLIGWPRTEQGLALRAGRCDVAAGNCEYIGDQSVPSQVEFARSAIG